MTGTKKKGANFGEKLYSLPPPPPPPPFLLLQHIIIIFVEL